LDAIRAAQYATAQQQIVEETQPVSNLEIQSRLVKLVQQCESLETEDALFKFDGLPDLESWLEGIKTNHLEFLYKKTKKNETNARAEDEIVEDAASDFRSGVGDQDNGGGGKVTSARSTTKSMMEEYEVDYLESPNTRRSRQCRKPPMSKLGL
jgi:hypothetical protein